LQKRKTWISNVEKFAQVITASGRAGIPIVGLCKCPMGFLEAVSGD